MSNIISVNRQELFASLKLACAVSEKKSHIPALSCVSIQTDFNFLHIRASDLEVHLHSRLDQRQPPESVPPAQVVVNAKAMLDLVKGIKSEKVSFEFDESGKQVAVSDGNGMKMNLTSAVEPGDFPASPAVDAPVSVAISAGEMNQLLAQAEISAASEETRYSIKGVKLTFQRDGVITAVSTDGHRLSLVHGIALVQSDAEGIIPVSAIKALKFLDPQVTLGIRVEDKVGAVEGSDGQEGIEGKPGKLAFEWSEGAIIALSVDKTFPSYEQVIPKDSANVAQIRTDDLLPLLDQAISASPKRGGITPIQFDFDNTSPTAGVESGRDDNPDHPKMSAKLPTRYSGEPLRVAMNPLHVRDFLEAAGGEVEMRINSNPKRPILLSPAGRANRFQYAMMPVEIN